MSRSTSIPGATSTRARPCVGEPEHAALGHEQHLLAAAARVVGAERHLPDPVHELGMLAFGKDAHLPVLDRDVQSAGAEGPHEDQLLRVLADVDEATTAWRVPAELARVDVAARVALAKTQEGGIEAAAVDEVEGGGMLDDGLEVGGDAEVEPAPGHAADDARIDDHRQQVLDPLFTGHLGHLVGDRADADVDDAVRRQLEHCAACDQLAVAEFDREHALGRLAQLARERRVEARAIGLHVVLAFGQHDTVDQAAGDLDVARV